MTGRKLVSKLHEMKHIVRFIVIICGFNASSLPKGRLHGAGNATYPDEYHMTKAMHPSWWSWKKCKIRQLAMRKENRGKVNHWHNVCSVSRNPSRTNHHLHSQFYRGYKTSGIHLSTIDKIAHSFAHLLLWYHAIITVSHFCSLPCLLSTESAVHHSALINKNDKCPSSYHGPFLHQPLDCQSTYSQTIICTSEATLLRINNNNENFSTDVLYFVGENLKIVQEESRWYFRIFAEVQVSELCRHVFLGTHFRTLFYHFMFCTV